jgi:hypothetical protein
MGGVMAWRCGMRQYGALTVKEDIHRGGSISRSKEASNPAKNMQSFLQSVTKGTAANAKAAPGKRKH